MAVASILAKRSEELDDDCMAISARWTQYTQLNTFALFDRNCPSSIYSRRSSGMAAETGPARDPVSTRRAHAPYHQEVFDALF